MAEILQDATKDALLIFPFIFIIYMLMEIWEEARNKEKIEKALSGSCAPVVAAFTGIIPECGFSVMCAKLYDTGFITTGTLIAAFVSTNDEGLIVLLSGGAGAYPVLLLLAFKIIFAVFLGLLLNVIMPLNKTRRSNRGCCLECGQRHGGFFDTFVMHPFYHSAKTFVYIFAVNIFFGVILYFIGEDALNRFISGSAALQPVIAPIIGLIPNCASSILLASAYLKGAIGFQGLLAGLVANAGLGLAVVAKNSENRKKTLFIILILYLAGVFSGYCAMI